MEAQIKSSIQDCLIQILEMIFQIINFQTQTTGNLPNADFGKIFAISDMHLSVI